MTDFAKIDLSLREKLDRERAAGFYWVRQGDSDPFIAEWQHYDGPLDHHPVRAWWNFPGQGVDDEDKETPVEVLGGPIPFRSFEDEAKARAWDALGELLQHLGEEASEVIHAASKFRRFGPEGRDPRVKDGPSDREATAYEYGQLLAVQECIDALDPELFADESVQWGRRAKLEKLGRYLKHSTLQVTDEGVTLCLK